MIGVITQAITVIFFLVVLSYYVLLFMKKKNVNGNYRHKLITVIIPAHNEERYIKECLESVILAEGKKEIIVIDDGSKDSTAKIVRDIIKDNPGIIFLQTKHSGKAASINLALEKSSGDLIAVVDADSVIMKDALVHMAYEFRDKKVGGACGVVRVKNRKRFICMWVHIEQVYNSLMRSIFSKINANVVTPGPLSMYRKSAMDKVGGFSTDGYSEDIDITIRLIREGYKISYSEKSVSDTNMPYETKWFFMQRRRFAKGMLRIFRKHLSINRTIIDLYTLPLYVFNYMQAVIMGAFTLYQVTNGYIIYFFDKGVIFSYDVLMFFLNWFSIIGFVKWIYNVFIGIEPLTFITIAGVISTLLTYPLYIISIIKYDKKIDLLHIIPLIFMAPFWLLIMLIYMISLPEYFKKKQYNIWKKYE